MGLPPLLREGLDAALTDLGAGSVQSLRPVHGGCIHNGSRLESSSGELFFLKWSPGTSPDVFAAEAEGLNALREAAGRLRVPEVRAISGDPEQLGWLLMEFIEPGRAAPDFFQRLGTGLAEVHAQGADRTFGWTRDNWIGSLGQDNTPTESWADFWLHSRLGVQLELGRRAGHVHDRIFDEVCDRLHEAIGDVSTPSLLHGDLWSGNVIADSNGDPVLIDPAVYLGHGEVDLAMTDLFGGFDPAFMQAYRAERPIHPAYAEMLRDLYQLYYLLVHVNLFGSSYEAGSLKAAQRVIAALG